MDKKSFVRGFGMGVLFTAIILGVSCFIRLSDAQTISRAKKLGMQFTSNNEKVSLATPKAAEKDKKADSVSDDASSEKKDTADSKKNDTSANNTANKDDSSKNANQSNTKKDTTANNNTSKKDTADTNNTTSSNNNSSSKKAKDTDKAFQAEKKKMEQNINDASKKLTISDGDYSSSVSSKLEQMGAIDSASDFDKYMEEHGYSKVINSGTYDISLNDTYEDIAKKITRRN